MPKSKTKTVSKKNVKPVRKHIVMKTFEESANNVVKVKVNGGDVLVKSDNWYVPFPSSEGAVGYPWLHCLVKKGVALFATEANYMRPRKYAPLEQFLKPEYDAFERRS